MSVFRIAPTESISLIAGAMASLPWPAGVGLVNSIVSQLGWQRYHRKNGIGVRTDLDISSPRTTFLAEDGLILEIDVFVSDYLTDGDLTVVGEAWEVTELALTGALGVPSGRDDLDVWWDLPTGSRVHLLADNVVILQWLSPVYAGVECAEAYHGISPDRVLGQDG